MRRNRRRNRYGGYLPVLFPLEVAEELLAEAARQERTVSELMRFAWRAARKRIQAMEAPLGRN